MGIALNNVGQARFRKAALEKIKAVLHPDGGSFDLGSESLKTLNSIRTKHRSKVDPLAPGNLSKGNEIIKTCLEHDLGKNVNISFETFLSIYRTDDSFQYDKLEAAFALAGLKFDEARDSGSDHFDLPSGKVDLGYVQKIAALVGEGKQYVLVHGPGGVGKSTAADGYLTSQKHLTPCYRVVAASREGFVADFANKVKEMALDGVWIPPQSFRDPVVPEALTPEKWLRAFKDSKLEKRVIIHLDNVAGPDSEGDQVQGGLATDFGWLDNQIPKHTSATWVISSQSRLNFTEIFGKRTPNTCGELYISSLDEAQTIKYLVERSLVVPLMTNLEGLTREVKHAANTIYDALKGSNSDGTTGTFPLDLEPIAAIVAMTENKALELCRIASELCEAKITVIDLLKNEDRTFTGRLGSLSALGMLLTHLNGGTDWREPSTRRHGVRFLLDSCWLNAENVPRIALDYNLDRVTANVDYGRLLDRQLIEARPEVEGLGDFFFVHRTRQAMLRQLQHGAPSDHVLEQLYRGLARLWPVDINESSKLSLIRNQHWLAIRDYKTESTFVRDFRSIIAGNTTNMLESEVFAHLHWMTPSMFRSIWKTSNSESPDQSIVVDFSLFIKLSSLNLHGTNVAEIKGLDQCSNLQNLNLSNTRVNDIKGLNQCSNLQSLDLSVSEIKEIKGLEQCVSLQSLDLSNTKIKEIKGLEFCTELQSLLLCNTKIKEIKGLEQCTKLQNLNLSGTGIAQIKGLDRCTNLKHLKLIRTYISEIRGLSKCTELESLYLRNTYVSEIKGLEKCTKLQNLYLSRNFISEIKGLEQCINLRHLYLSRTFVSEIKGLKSCTELQSLHLSNTPVSKIGGLGNCSNLRTFDSYGTQITDFLPISLFIGCTVTLPNGKNWTVGEPIPKPYRA
jgi:Leucine Rich repeats (2 copies)